MHLEKGIRKSPKNKSQSQMDSERQAPEVSPLARAPAIAQVESGPLECARGDSISTGQSSRHKVSSLLIVL